MNTSVLDTGHIQFIPLHTKSLKFFSNSPGIKKTPLEATENTVYEERPPTCDTNSWCDRPLIVTARFQDQSDNSTYLEFFKYCFLVK